MQAVAARDSRRSPAHRALLSRDRGRDAIRLRRSAVWLSAVALLGYWVLLVVFGDPGQTYSLAGNAELKLDRALLGDAHLYHGEGIPFDPEGLLSTLPAVVNAIAGFLAGGYLRRRGPSYETIAKSMLVGASLVVLALAWHPFQSTETVPAGFGVPGGGSTSCCFRQ